MADSPVSQILLDHHQRVLNSLQYGRSVYAASPDMPPPAGFTREGWMRKLDEQIAASTEHLERYGRKQPPAKF